VIRGIYRGRDKTVDESAFFFQWDYLNETMKKTAPLRADQVGWYMIGVTSPSLAADVAVRIDRAFKNSLAETLTETEKAFQLSFISMTEAIVIAIKIVSFVVIFIIMAVVANTMAMTARERIGEYAIFKTLGFGGWHLAGLIFGESLFITMIGCVLGIALTFPAAHIFSNALSTYFPVFNVARKTIYMDVVASISIGMAAALFPTWRAIKIRIADGLRRIG
jgi:putative ABC transport system permease protein